MLLHYQNIIDVRKNIVVTLLCLNRTKHSFHESVLIYTYLLLLVYLYVTNITL